QTELVLRAAFPILDHTYGAGFSVGRTVKDAAVLKLAQLPLPIPRHRVRAVATSVAAAILPSVLSIPLGDAIPWLTRITRPVQTATLSARLRALFARKKIVEWHQVSSLRLGDLLGIQNFGRKTANELLVKAISEVLRADPTPIALIHP